MKRVAYHRLAAAELIKSARFYDRRRPLLGDRFLSSVAAVQKLIQKQPPAKASPPVAGDDIMGEVWAAQKKCAGKSRNPVLAERGKRRR